jgi:hypothetical protein
MHDQRGHDHVRADAESGDAGADAGDEGERAEEIGGDGEDAEEGGDADAREPAEGAVDPPAAEPAEGLLQTVRQDDDGEGETKNEEREGAVGGEDAREGDGAGGGMLVMRSRFLSS